MLALILASLIQSITELRPLMNLKDEKDFTSWVAADYWLFGLIYKVVFCNEAPVHDKARLQHLLSTEIKEKRDIPAYSKSPNRLGYLRERITESIRIYESC